MGYDTRFNTLKQAISVLAILTITGLLTVSDRLWVKSDTVGNIVQVGNAADSTRYFTVSSTSTSLLNALLLAQGTTSNASYTVTATDTVVFLQPSGAMTVALPTASGQAGRTLVFKDALGTSASTTNIITLDGNASQTIDGQLTKVLNIGYDKTTLISNGSNWLTIGEDKPSFRWLRPYHWSPAATSQAFTAGTEICLEFEVNVDSYLDNVTYVVGATAAGNVKAGIFGPIVLEETSHGAPLLVQSATHSTSVVNAPHPVDFTPTLARKGRYYACLLADSSSHTFMRQANQAQVVGWGQTEAGQTVVGGFQSTMDTPTNTGSALPALVIRVAR